MNVNQQKIKEVKTTQQLVLFIIWIVKTCSSSNISRIIFLAISWNENLDDIFNVLLPDSFSSLSVKIFDIHGILTYAKTKFICNYYYCLCCLLNDGETKNIRNSSDARQKKNINIIKKSKSYRNRYTLKISSNISSRDVVMCLLI